MPFFLSERDPDATEWMDQPDCSHEELENTYRQFSVVNALISNWKSIYKRQIRPFAAAQTGKTTVLDIGFGGGDIPLKIANWSHQDQLDLQITAIETDKRAFDYVQQHASSSSVRFLHCSSSDLVEREKFDFVISNHLLHHIPQTELLSFLNQTRRLCSFKVLLNDIERSDVGYLLFNLLSRPVFRSSFITHDGLASIRRSYTYKELQEQVPKHWQVKRLFPYRLLLTYQHDRYI